MSKFLRLLNERFSKPSIPVRCVRIANQRLLVALNIGYRSIAFARHKIGSR
jgi:hypothetical protein